MALYFFPSPWAVSHRPPPSAFSGFRERRHKTGGGGARAVRTGATLPVAPGAAGHVLYCTVRVLLIATLSAAVGAAGGVASV